MALDFQRPDPSSPAAVASAQFTLNRRGYREEEVRDFLRQVSVELARLLERERFLESELKAIQARGPIDVGAIDEAAVTELLGAEAARVLTVAREAAQAMRDRAAESAEQIVRDATRESTRLLEESTVEASRRRSDVSGEAEQELELAKQQGREIVAEVRAYRERVLSDLAKKTEEARRELERLVHERERLLGAFERARHAATDVVGDLNEFDESLRGTGVTPPLVPPDAPPPPRPTAANTTPIFDAKQYLHEFGDGTKSSPSETTEDASGHAADSATGDATQPAAEPAADDAPNHATNETKELMHDAPTTPEVTSPSPEHPAVSESPSSSENDGHLAEVVSIADRRRQKDSPREAPQQPASPTPDRPVFERVVATPDTTATKGATTHPGADTHKKSAPPAPVADNITSTTRVDAIFARLRNASTTRVATETQQELQTPPTNKEAKPKPTKPKTAKALTPASVDASVFRRRAEVVTPALESLIRVLKRQIADDENAVLTHVSTKRSTLTTEAMLSTVDEHALRYTEMIRELATSIAVDAARSLSAARRADVRTAISQGSVLEAITAMLSSELLQPLHSQLAAAIKTAAGGRDALLTAVRALFQETKTQRVAGLASDIAHFTYARGLFLGCDASSHVCWAVDPDGPACADAEDNSLAGAVRRGDSFPTGHAHPLAHAGCRCLVVPLDK